jgi:type IV secretory pathway VirB10-like protein
MNGGTWDPWKFTAIGLALVMVTAVVTGLVVASWTGTPSEQQTAAPKPSTSMQASNPSASPRSAVTRAPSTPSAPAPAAPARPSIPSEATIEACNRAAEGAPTTKDKTVEIVKDGAIAAALGAAVGAAGGAIADGGKGAGKGAAIGGVLGAGAGALYGLNENRKNDGRYREAYAACMRSRGFGG